MWLLQKEKKRQHTFPEWYIMPPTFSKYGNLSTWQDIQTVLTHCSSNHVWCAVVDQPARSYRRASEITSSRNQTPRSNLPRLRIFNIVGSGVRLPTTKDSRRWDDCATSFITLQPSDPHLSSWNYTHNTCRWELLRVSHAVLRACDLPVIDRR